MTELRQAVRFRRFPEATYFFSATHKFIYAPIPKAACSTVKSVLYQVYKAERPNLPSFLPVDYPGKAFHLFMDHNFTLSRLEPGQARALLRDRQIFKFTFIRNPLARLASAYLNKFVQHRFDTDQWEHTRPTLMGILGQQANPLFHTISFSQFVEHVCQAPDKELDKHWRPMHNFLNLDLGLFIGRVETMDRDYEVVREKAGLRTAVTHENKANRMDNAELPDDAYWAMDADALRALPALPSVRQMYNSRLEQAVRDRYRADFELFGY